MTSGLVNVDNLEIFSHCIAPTKQAEYALILIITYLQGIFVTEKNFMAAPPRRLSYFLFEGERCINKTFPV